MQSVVSKICNGWYVPNKTYYKPLPLELQEWYGYCSDGGHSIVCCLKQDYKPEGDLTGCLLPAPVKSVLKSYEVLRGYVVVDLPYSSTLGLLTPEEDDEY